MPTCAKSFKWRRLISSSKSVPVPEALHRFLHENSTFIVVGHIEPDGDCIASQLVLASVLRRLGKTVTVANPGPFDRREIRSFSKEFVADPQSLTDVFDARIVVDCSSADRLGVWESVFPGIPTAVIDHHSNGDPSFGDIRYVDASVPAAALLILSLIDSLHQTPLPEEAELLFLGFSTDTGFFRYLESSHAEYLSMAARLVELGASPRKTFAAMYHDKSWQSRKYLARALDRAEFLANGSAVLTYYTLADAQKLGKTNRDSDSLYASLLAIRDIEVLAVIREDSVDRCTISFRSSGTVDVGSIASSFGGGGHRLAAGCSLDEPLIDVIPRIRNRLAILFPPDPV